MKKYNVGLIGAGFMGKAHSMAYACMPMFFWPAPGIPVRKTIADVDEATAKEAATRFGFENYTGNWKDIINDPEIDIVDIATPNHMHAEMAVAAAEAGKHIMCEKPIARTTEEGKQMLDAVKKHGVKNMLAFNYRRTPAVALAKKFIDDGELGKILNFRGTYLQDWSADPDSPLSWRFQKKIAGSGAMGDIATHVIDMAQYLVGDIAQVMGMLKTYVPKRPTQSGGVDNLGTVKVDKNAQLGDVDVDDETMCLMRFDNGAVGSMEATRNGWGRNNFLTFEIHGEKGSILFNYERRDELQVCFASDQGDRRGYRTVYSGPAHPYGDSLWPIPALGIGYGETKIIECYDFIKSIHEDTTVSPGFEEGYRISLVCDAITRSSETDKWEDVKE